MAGLQADNDILAGLAEAKRDELELEKKGISPASSTHEPELDGVHDGLEFPTEEEKSTLRRVSDTIPWSAYCKYSSTLNVAIPRPTDRLVPQSSLFASFQSVSRITVRPSSS